MHRSRRAVLAVVAAVLATSTVTAGPASARGNTASKPTTRSAVVPGYDIGWPQCPSSVPGSAAFGIVGVNHGLAYSVNSCLSSQYRWAPGFTKAPAFYTNTANPGPISTHWNNPGFPQACVDPSSASDTGCAYDYGWNAAASAFATAASAATTTVAATHAWYLDVETGNSWNGSTSANAADIQGGIDYLHSRGVATVGVYSTGYQWGVITGGYGIAGAPDWVAGASGARQAAGWCGPSYSFSGGAVHLVQYPQSGFDANYACPGT